MRPFVVVNKKQYINPKGLLEVYKKELEVYKSETPVDESCSICSTTPITHTLYRLCAELRLCHDCTPHIQTLAKQNPKLLSTKGYVEFDENKCNICNADTSGREGNSSYCGTCLPVVEKLQAEAVEKSIRIGFTGTRMWYRDAVNLECSRYQFRQKDLYLRYWAISRNSLMTSKFETRLRQHLLTSVYGSMADLVFLYKFPRFWSLCHHLRWFTWVSSSQKQEEINAKTKWGGVDNLLQLRQVIQKSRDSKTAETTEYLCVARLLKEPVKLELHRSEEVYFFNAEMEVIGLRFWHDEVIC